MFKSRLKKRPNIEIIPMIDVIFFLLVFFMLFTTFKTTPHGLDLQLPKATTAVQTKTQNLTVYITNDGRIFLQDKPVNVTELKNQIQAQIASKPDTVVILQADTNARYGTLIQVMDAISQVGGYNFALAAEKEESNK